MYRYIELEYSAKIILKKKHTEHKQHIRAPTMPIQHYLLTFFIFNFALNEFVWSMCSNGGQKRYIHSIFCPAEYVFHNFHFLTHTLTWANLLYSRPVLPFGNVVVVVFRCPLYFYLALLHGNTLWWFA